MAQRSSTLLVKMMPPPYLGDHVRKMLQDMFTATFFEMTDVDEKIATHRGTRPGDAVGDILFNMLFRLILKDVRIELQQHPEAEWIGTPVDGEGVFNNGPIPSTAFAEIAFVDDVAYIVHSKSPEMTVGLVQRHFVSLQRCRSQERSQSELSLKVRLKFWSTWSGPGSRASRTRCGMICVAKSLWFQRTRLAKFNWCITTSTLAALFRRRLSPRKIAIVVLLRLARRLGC